MLRRVLAAVVLALLLLGAGAGVAQAAHDTWGDVVDDMEAVLDGSYDTYVGGDARAAKDQVDEAYFGYYELLGFEKTVMAYVSGARASAVEYEFALTKKAMLAGDPDDEVREHLDTLIGMLREDAVALDGEEENATSTFLASLLIILREGAEAIIVVAAILAYLVKSGNRDKVRTVYAGVGLALAASVLLAVAVNALTGLAGANQEIIEGATILVAVAMLIYVSSWILSKSSAQAWERYIAGKTQDSLSRGSLMSLAFVAFLAVFREGAETILFYQALLARGQTHMGAIWAGLGVGVVLLVVVYLLIRYLSIKIPLRPFFLATSLLLALMAFSFVGSGVKEFQEGNVLSVTPVSGVPSIDLLGVYPTAETLTAQAVVLALLIALFAAEFRRAGRARVAADSPGADSPGAGASAGDVPAPDTPSTNTPTETAPTETAPTETIPTTDTTPLEATR